jgi:hypothetical protein
MHRVYFIVLYQKAECLLVKIKLFALGSALRIESILKLRNDFRSAFSNKKHV